MIFARLQRTTIPLFFVVSLLIAATAAKADAGITIGTGGKTGVYFAAGNAICARIEASTKLTCEARSTGGSVANLKALAAGTLDFAVVQSDWHFHAYEQTSVWDGPGLGNLRSVMALHAEPIQIITAKDSDVREWHKLKGKRVNIGNPGSGQRGTMDLLMAVYGWDEESFRPASELTSELQVEALCRGTIDAFVYVVGIPNQAIRRAVTECHATIIGPASRLTRKLAVSARPYYAKATIKKGTYRLTQPKVKTFGVVATLVTTNKVDAKKVETLVTAITSDLKAFRALHPALADLTPKHLATAGLTAPLHPAAKAGLTKAMGK